MNCFLVVDASLNYRRTLYWDLTACRGLPVPRRPPSFVSRTLVLEIILALVWTITCYMTAFATRVARDRSTFSCRRWLPFKWLNSSIHLKKKALEFLKLLCGFVVLFIWNSEAPRFGFAILLRFAILRCFSCALDLALVDKKLFPSTFPNCNTL